MAIPYQHAPVMAKEVVEYLEPGPGKVFVDCTLGGGGHAAALLRNDKCQMSNIKLIGFDQDTDAIAAAKERLAGYSGIEYINDNFSNLKKHIQEKVDGFLFDLGVSSYQIDDPARGFSFRQDGPIDMRMDRAQGLTAFDIVNTRPIDEFERILRDYGEERFARRITNSIYIIRKAKKIETTFELKEIIEKAIPTWRKRESVARVFQALRIAVNSELENLQKGLKDSIDLLKSGGRIAVLSYHSLEDRIVKNAFRGAARDGILKVLTGKPLSASEDEIKENPRAKSAKLRAAEKI